jgi:hypothetical protein
VGLDCFEGQALCIQTALPSFPEHIGQALPSQMRKTRARLFQPSQSPDDRLHWRYPFLRVDVIDYRQRDIEFRSDQCAVFVNY